MASYNFSRVGSAKFKQINRMLYLYKKVKAENITFTEVQIVSEIENLVRTHPEYNLNPSDIGNLVTEAKYMTGTTRVPTDLLDLNTQFKNYARGEVDSADNKFDVAKTELDDSDKIIQDGTDAQAELDFDNEQRRGKYIKNTVFGVAIGILVSAVLPAAGIPLLMSQLGVAAIGGVVGGVYGGKKSIEKAIKEGCLLSVKDRAELQKKVRAGNTENRLHNGAKRSAYTTAQANKSCIHIKFADYESSSNELDLIAEEQRQLDIEELNNIRTSIDTLRASACYISAPGPGYADSDQIKTDVEAIYKKFDPADSNSYVADITNADYGDPAKANIIKAKMNEAKSKLAEVRGLIDGPISKLGEAAANFTSAKTELEKQYTEYNKYFAVLSEANVRSNSAVSAAHNNVAGIYHRLLSDVSADKEEDIKVKIEKQEEAILDLKHEVAKTFLDGETVVASPSNDNDRAKNDAIKAKGKVESLKSTSPPVSPDQLKNAKLMESICLSVYRMYEIKEYIDSVSSSASKKVHIKRGTSSVEVEFDKEMNEGNSAGLMYEVLKLKAEAVSTSRSKSLKEIEQEIAGYVSIAERYKSVHQAGSSSSNPAEKEPEMVM